MRVKLNVEITIWKTFLELGKDTKKQQLERITIVGIFVADNLGNKHSISLKGCITS